MAKIDDDKLLKVLLKEGVIEPEEAEACKSYQERHLKQRGAQVSLTDTLKKLDILPASKLDSFIRALESSSVRDTTPVFTSEGKVDIEEMDRPRIAPAALSGAKKSKKFTIRQEIAEVTNNVEAPKPEATPKKSKPTSLFAVNQEKQISTEPKGPLKPVVKPPQKPKQPEPQVQEEIPQAVLAESTEVKMTTAYLLLIFLGFLGIHRYYLRKDRSAILYSLTFGFFFVGVIIDLFILPWIVMGIRKEGISDSSLEKINKYTYREEVDNPHWNTFESGMDKFKSFIEYNIQLIAVITVPLVLTMVAIITAEAWIVVVMAGIISCLLLHAYYDDILSSSIFTYIPLFSFINNVCLKLKSLYFNKKPLPTIAYILYPIWAPFSMIKSIKKKEELILFSGIIALNLAVFVGYSLYQIRGLSIEQLQTFLTSQIFMSLMAFVITVGLLTTFITTICRWQIQGKQKVAQIGSVWGMIVSIIALLIFAGVLYKDKYCFYHKEKEKLQIRLETKEFRSEIEQICRSYLRYITAHPQMSDQHKSQALHRFLGGILSPKELKLFSVRSHSVSDLSKLIWVDSSVKAVVAIDQDRVLINKINLLSSVYRDKISDHPKNEESYLKNIHDKIYPEFKKQQGLIADTKEK
ncbi:TM2 domain-containing protein [Candidatus Uabimicrobium sp. HlEnr_7]|uniref:TM2 domain-containing protein n=1 Tax=Candidatus Uabimicrobium helgolandensis TaxID=3095367 RepID=UPI0035570122